MLWDLNETFINFINSLCVIYLLASYGSGYRGK